MFVGGAHFHRVRIKRHGDQERLYLHFFAGHAAVERGFQLFVQDAFVCGMHIDLPQTVTVINQALIRDLGMQSMADVARYVPGISMANGEGNRDSPIFRGSASAVSVLLPAVVRLVR